MLNHWFVRMFVIPLIVPVLCVGFAIADEWDKLFYMTLPPAVLKVTATAGRPGPYRVEGLYQGGLRQFDGGVNDYARIFSPAAVRQANAILHKLYDAHHQDVRYRVYIRAGLYNQRSQQALLDDATVARTVGLQVVFTPADAEHDVTLVIVTPCQVGYSVFSYDMKRRIVGRFAIAALTAGDAATRGSCRSMVIRIMIWRCWRWFRPLSRRRVWHRVCLHRRRLTTAAS